MGFGTAQGVKKHILAEGNLRFKPAQSKPSLERKNSVSTPYLAISTASLWPPMMMT